MTQTIRVLIVDDHPVLRDGLRALIGSTPGMEVVDVAQDGFEAVAKAKELQPDVILLDLMMPRMGGIEATAAIRRNNPDARILVLTSFAGDDQVFPAIKAGALGYLLKDSTTAELLEAIRDIHQGKPILHPTIARKLMGELNRPSPRPPSEEPLTEREVEVLRRVAQGLSNQEIAAALQISELTVRTHVSNILAKLHLANRTQAALHALRSGLASLDES